MDKWEFVNWVLKDEMSGGGEKALESKCVVEETKRSAKHGSEVRIIVNG